MMKMKKLLVFVFGIVLIVALAACNDEGGASGNGNNDAGETTAHSFPAADMSEYPIEGAHRFYSVTMEEALALRDDADFNGILYFGFPVCPWCQSAVPVLNDAANSAGVDIFYVSRAHDLREGVWVEWDIEMAWWLYDNGVENMLWLNEEGQPVAPGYEEEEGYRPNINVPQVLHLRNGEILGNHRHTLPDHDARERDLTEEETALLYQIYLGIFDPVNEVAACSINDTEDDDGGCS